MPAHLTAQDQRASIAISVAANVSSSDVLRRLRKAKDKRNVYSIGKIERVYKEFNENTKPDTNDQRCENQRPLSDTDQGNSDGIEHLM